MERISMKKLKEFVGLCEDYPKYAIKTQLGISESVFTVMLRAAFHHELIDDEFMIKIMGNTESPIYTRKAMSNNEEDYGQLERKKVFITREGILTFDGNSKIEKPISRLRQEVMFYKMMAHNNCIPLLKIPKHKHDKYGDRN